MLVEIFDHMNLCTAAEVTRMLPLVSPQRRAEAQRYTHVHGQFCCLRSYLMLTELVGAISPTLDYTCPEFEYNDYGKPAIKGRPDMQFSISHTKNAIAVVISSAPIGIDIEKIHAPSEALVKKTMNEAEQNRIAQAKNPAAEFTSLWTQKEALLKLRGTGIVDELHHVLDDTQDILFETHICPHYVWTVAQHRNIGL